MQETANAQDPLQNEESIPNENEMLRKKKWIKPESSILNVNSGGGTIVDGPDTRASFPIS
jgi:hypothetical protein